MVDIHCHILPGIDDGSDSWETTLEMCRIAADDGITHIVATPHANEEFMYSRNGHGKLLSELQARVPSLKFTLGCDFHMSYENIEDALLDPAPFAIGDTKYILVEFNNFSPPQQACSACAPETWFRSSLTRNATRNSSAISRRWCSGLRAEL
jgi:protein-tyrosine phosphatase